MSELLYNLVHNSIEALSEIGGRERTLEIKTRSSDGGAVAIEVFDNGVGIDPEKVSSIFEPFVTTKPEGMGLGLAICRKIMELHEGQISASSLWPHGTVFRVQLSNKSADGNARR